VIRKLQPEGDHVRNQQFAEQVTAAVHRTLAIQASNQQVRKCWKKVLGTGVAVGRAKLLARKVSCNPKPREAEYTAARLGSSRTMGTRQVQHCGTPLCQWQLEGETVRGGM
jgi:hypothetical protein